MQLKKLTICISLGAALWLITACGRADTGQQDGTVVAPATSVSAAYPISQGVDYQPSPTPGGERFITPIAMEEEPPKSLGVVIDGSFRIIHLEIGGTANKAGLQEGDVLRAIDGVALQDHIQEVKTLLWDTKKEHTIQVQRNGETMTVKVVLANRVFSEVTQTPVEPNDYL